MVNGHQLAPVHLVEAALLLDERDEVGVHLTLHLGLTLVTGTLVHLLDLLVLFELLTNLLGGLVVLLSTEFVEKGSLVDDVGIILHTVQEHMENGYGSAGVMSELLHVEQVLAVLLGVEGFLLLSGEGSLGGSLLEEEDDSLDWSGDHVLGPVLSAEHILDGVVGSVES